MDLANNLGFTFENVANMDVLTAKQKELVTQARQKITDKPEDFLEWDEVRKSLVTEQAVKEFGIMIRKIRINIEAKDDVQNAIDYYRLQQKGLGKKFESTLNIAIKRMQFGELGNQ